MKIQYISCHSVLEYDEVKLLTDLGYEVYANGVYRDPKGAHTLPRPGIPNAPFDEEFFKLTAEHPKTNLPPELIEPYDVFIIMSGEGEQPLFRNWENIKHKRVIWRGIGQNKPATENQLKKYFDDGLEIVRYSPKERKYANYAGETAMIRFYKDPEEYKGWNGKDKRVINFTQSLKGRGAFVHYDEIMGSLAGFNSKVYGSGNSDLGSFNGGEVPYEMSKKLMQDARAYVYGGTWPACYTLSIMEVMMTGMPVVAISKKLAHLSQYEQFNFYEVDEIIENGVNGFVCDTVQEMRQRIEELLNDYNLAKRISAEARKTAIKVWGKDKIAKQWDALLKGENKNVDKN